MTHPRAAIAAGLAWRAALIALAGIGLWVTIATVGDWIADRYPNPPPCADCYGEWND